MKNGLVVDIETTGLNSNEDKIIEFGLLEFAFDDHSGPSIRSMYSGLEDPSIPLKPEIVRLTGLNDELLRGQRIDWELVARHWQRAEVIVAHNAEFDRSFLSLVPQLGGMEKHWACSVRHIDWRSKKFGSLKLNYLAADHGFVNPFAHRALFDCATTYRLIAPHLRELMQGSQEPEVDVFATGSPFESKDILKANGYRWDVEKRVWRKRIMSAGLEAERAFLTTEVYKGPSKHMEEEYYFNTSR